MDENEIHSLLSDCPLYGGTFASDELPENPRVPIAFVVNTDPSSLPGTHWQVVHLLGNGKAEFYDSFGFPPDEDNISNYLERYVSEWEYSSMSAQHPVLASCGMFCINFIRCRSAGLSYSDFLDQFSFNQLENEDLIVSYGRRMNLVASKTH